ncbi:hypothetical protein CVT25_004553 [Psilocybe cyanescens]|uniref:Protein kinase domain-containing protein n=1 Tax=Psilocybe cyanescens TaxID=93625 RepID=A0A409XMJ9_PSICY|nr:hypothetical protein CVT25_004553 [Psilocybe cyanescens]
MFQMVETSTYELLPILLIARLALTVNLASFALKSNLCPGGTGPAESIPGIVTPFYQTANEYLEGKSPTASVLPLLIDIAKALQYLHSFSPPIVQGIIRGTNVLISKGPKALLTDIGLINLPLALDHEEGRWMAPELLGTLAPELFHSELVTGKRKQNAFSITPASDVFSFGLLALELITRKQPYDYVENLGINEIIGFRKCGMAQLRRPENVPAMTDELWNLLEQCVKYDPTKRPHMDSVLRFLEAIHSERGPFEELTEDTEEDIEESIFEY